MHPLIEKVIDTGEGLSKDEALHLAYNLDECELEAGADAVRAKWCGDDFDFCAIINGKSGACSEDCKYCAQSHHYQASIEEYPLLKAQTIVEDALLKTRQGVHRYSVVTSGRALTDSEVDALCDTYARIADASDIFLCASLGLLTKTQFEKLYASGVRRYHNNLETSRRFFPHVCTTHSYDDKLKTIELAREVGFEICSGGIIGLGETVEDRIDMVLTLRSLGVVSIPINVLNPIAQTPFEHNKILSNCEVAQTVALFRLIVPKTALRLAGGRELLGDQGERAMRAGANAAITGDMLTTKGISVSEDKALISKLGFEATKI